MGILSKYHPLILYRPPPFYQSLKFLPPPLLIPPPLQLSTTEYDPQQVILCSITHLYLLMVVVYCQIFIFLSTCPFFLICLFVPFNDANKCWMRHGPWQVMAEQWGCQDRVGPLFLLNDTLISCFWLLCC